MSKSMCLIVGLFLGMGIMFGLVALTHSSDQLQTVVMEGDEMPGIGGDEEQPDVVYAWYNHNDQHIHLEYADAWIAEHSKK